MATREAADRKEVQRIYCAVLQDDRGLIYCFDCRNLMHCPMARGTWSHQDSPGGFCPYYRNRKSGNFSALARAVSGLLDAFI